MNATRAAILKLLTTNPTPTKWAIDQVTLNLYRDEVERKVRKLQQERANQAAYNRRMQEQQFYPFLGPLPQPNLISKTDTEEVWDKPTRPSYKVKLVDLEAFCVEMKLDPKAMRELGEGTRREHRGWMRAPWTGNSREAGQVYRERTPLNPPKQPQKRVRSGNPMAAPMVAWTPSK